MATNITLQQESPVAARQALQPVVGGGFGNMFSKEMGDWFATRRWIVQAVLWLAIINGFIAFILFTIAHVQEAAPQPGETPQSPLVMGLTLFFTFAVEIGSIGVIVMAQDEIVGEKQSGTAEWILSKPASRTAFIMSKLTANLVGILIFIVAIPAVVTFGEIQVAAGRTPDLLSYVISLVPIILTMLFFLTLTLMLGVLFDQRGPVLGISLGLLFLPLFLSGFVSQVNYILPAGMQNAALMLAQGQPLPDVLLYEIGATAVWCVVFTAIAVWRFQRQEL